MSIDDQQPTDGFEQLEGDAFPYHQSLIPSKGSIRGSVFNLAGATLGAGALTLPYAVAVSGVGFAVAQLVLAALLTVYTIRLLIRAGDLTKCVASTVIVGLVLYTILLTLLWCVASSRTKTCRSFALGRRPRSLWK